MPMWRSAQLNWHKKELGVIVPEGATADLSYFDSQSYLQVKEKAIAIEQLYAANKIPLPPTCDLARLVAEAKALSDSWFTNQIDSVTEITLFRVAYLDRIADAVLPLRDVLDRSRYLTKFTGSLDCLEREESEAKDILWELELWSILRWRSFKAVLAEPDIVVDFEDSQIGIACKKVYSVRNFETVLSRAVRQIKPRFAFGIVAVNLDDRVSLPSDKILRLSTQEAMARSINAFNEQFLRSQDRHFRKYLASGRLISALVSTRVFVDVYRGARCTPARQSTFWTIPGLPPEKAKLVNRFYMQFIG